ncbi:MAG: alpha/beta fold hydrolase, partial [Myxococcota bacterium]
MRAEASSVSVRIVQERITFTGAQGHQLAARIERPEGSPRAYALFAHCFTCSKDIAAASRISRALKDEGVAVVRFDFTGLGNSEGDFSNTNFSSNIDDLVAAANYMRETHRAPALLIGHSLGGAAVLAAAPQIPECRAVVTIGAPADPAHVQHLLSCSVEKIEREGHAQVELGGRTFTIKKQFLDDLNSQNQTQRIGRLGRALLILHSPQDELVAIDQARQLYEAA